MHAYMETGLDTLVVLDAVGEGAGDVLRPRAKRAAGSAVCAAEQALRDAEAAHARAQPVRYFRSGATTAWAQILEHLWALGDEHARRYRSGRSGLST